MGFCRWWNGEDISVRTIELRMEGYDCITVVETPEGHRKYVSGHRVREDEVGQNITVNTWELWSF